MSSTESTSSPSGSQRSTVVIEVTNTLSIDFTTGIQRVVREVVRGLAAQPGVEVLPVVQPRAGAPYRRLTGAELTALEHHPSGGRAGRRADAFGPLSSLARRVGDHPTTLRVRALVAAARRRRREHLPEHRELALERFPTGSVFLDIEGSWYDPSPRSELLARLELEGVGRAVFLHDVMPVLHPEWFPPLHVSVFTDWLRAHLHHSEHFLANSRCTAGDLHAAADRLGIDRHPAVTVVPLGADLVAAGASSAGSTAPDEAPALEGRRYVLVVGTLEPRKNQSTVLDAVDRLSGTHPELALVLVGKEGWMVADLVERIRSHHRLGSGLLWLGGVSDDELAWLYEHAFVVVAPSRYEGLGVPVLEALGRGCATIASTGGAQPEAAAGAAELFEPTDVDELVSLLAAHLDDPEHHAAALRRAAEHRVPSWTDTCRAVAGALRSDS